MKKRIVLLSTFVTLSLFAAVTGCKRSDDVYYGDLTFWNDNLNEDITVTIDDTYTDRITVNNYTSYCNASGRANFNLREGWHHYRAISFHYTWENDIYVDGNRCKLVEL